jgi:hypothetical protein
MRFMKVLFNNHSPEYRAVADLATGCAGRLPGFIALLISKK